MNSKHQTLLGTKANTLARLSAILQKGQILPLLSFTYSQWRRSSVEVLNRLRAKEWAGDQLIVRSSRLLEDSEGKSQAGAYKSIRGVLGPQAVASAVETVFDSYGRAAARDQVLIQPELLNMAASGVACLCDPSTGAPYRVVNWTTQPQEGSVTAGDAPSMHTWYLASYHTRLRPRDSSLKSLVGVMDELQRVLGHDRIEMEFGISADGRVIVFQVRALPPPPRTFLNSHRRILRQIEKKIVTAQVASPPTLGNTTCFGVMPDWNPAEMIGIRPKPLALSLYRDLVTDSIWSQARHIYGYRDMRNVPLLAEFSGLPYIDVRASFTSFVPKTLDDKIAWRLVAYYLEKLRTQPHLHDKVEFEIVLSCYDLTITEQLSVLAEYGFNSRERAAIRASLFILTERIVRGIGTWRDDLVRVQMLQKRRFLPAYRRNDQPNYVNAMLRDCAAYGTLPFAGLARAGFIAVQMLNSLVIKGALSSEDRIAFLGSVDAVVSALQRDFCTLPRHAFLKKYGHLRPGTYDILSPRYDEAPERYFNWTRAGEPRDHQPRYHISAQTTRAINSLLRHHNFSFRAPELLQFVRQAIRGREWAKFEFTRNLSDALTGIKRLGEQYGLTSEEMSYVDIGTIKSLRKRRTEVAANLRSAVARGKHAYSRTCITILPSLIFQPEDVWAFETMQTEPNFITQMNVTAPVANIDRHDAPEHKIAVVLSADPGYDWLFSRQILGLVTAYGGANSHMAIRALELGIPAVTGVGESRYSQLSKALAIEIDGTNHIVRALE
ncbi:MAG: PEP-utilizing enzyme [Verrucomicrobia bacterium]|nr:PEP-utilizing enzyme [Verrucomicrobiota bacterium]